MYCIIPESDNPYFNLAVEEMLLKNRTEEYLILGINRPSVIIGKHQSPHRESDTRFLYENNIPLARRITGGGTVYHDHGNLNFSFISQSEVGKQVNFRLYTKPVIDFLETLGINAKLEGKNDIKSNGFKISGNAEHVFRNRVLHHGTLLFNTSLKELRNSIRKDISCYTTRAVDSNPSHVMNLAPVLTKFRDIFEFRNEMTDYILKVFPGSTIYKLTATDTAEAENLATTKYSTWEWNYAYGPEYHFYNKFEFGGKRVSCRIHVKEGTIHDFIPEGSEELEIISAKLTGCRHIVDDLLLVFADENISITKEEIFNFF